MKGFPEPYLLSWAGENRWQRISSIFGICNILGSLLLTLLFGASINNSLGFTFGAAFLVLGAAYRFMPRWLKWFSKAAFLCAALFFLLMLGLMLREGAKNTARFTEDAVIVLGSGIRGAKIPVMLQRRLEWALAYARKNPRAVIVVTGGKGYGEAIPEAEAMRRYLLAQGIAAGRILIEDRSRNTYENLGNARTILATHFGGRPYAVAMVTSDFHMFRALGIAKRYGIPAKSFNAPLDWYLRPGSFLREALSIVKFWYLD
jgi:uncharacterized SAM-binding protein YcdF (DUF218 family)